MYVNVDPMATTLDHTLQVLELKYDYIKKGQFQTGLAIMKYGVQSLFSHLKNVQSEDYIKFIQYSDWTPYLKYEYEIHTQRFMNIRLRLSYIYIYIYISQIIFPIKTVLPVICPVISEKTFK